MPRTRGELQAFLIIVLAGVAIFFFMLWQAEKSYDRNGDGDFWEAEYRTAHAQAIRAVELGEKCATLLEAERKAKP